jgi:N-hydroxyarylamine O-acetyltransferase
MTAGEPGAALHRPLALAMDVDAYFRRIGYTGSTSATLETLAGIAFHHALAIPFENLSVIVSGAPDLELPALEAKLVRGRRGGYCYEQNGLLSAALASLGFDVMPLAARVRRGVPASTETPRSHMTLCVDVQGRRMLVDAGFGGLTLTAPVCIDDEGVQQTPHEPVRIVRVGDDHMLRADVRGAWIDLYRFDFSRQLPVDFAQQNWHTATRPGALFAHNLVVARPTPLGRHTLFNRTLTWHTLDGQRVQRTIGTARALRDALRDVFDLEPSTREIDAAWDVSGRGQPPGLLFA